MEGNSMIGIVYYSRTGNTKAVASLLADKLREQQVAVDVIEIEAVKRPGFLSAGRAAMKQQQLPIKNTDVDLGKYDSVIVGSPTWGGCPAPFIATFFSSAKNIKGKKASVFITGGGKPQPQGKQHQMVRQCLRDLGMELSDSFLGLQMGKGQIKDGQQQIDAFIYAVLNK